MKDFTYQKTTLNCYKRFDMYTCMENLKQESSNLVEDASKKVQEGASSYLK